MSKREIKQKIGFSFIGASLVVFLIGLFFIEQIDGRYRPISDWNPVLLFVIIILAAGGLSQIFTITNILYDNEEYKPNKDKPAIVLKIRLRAVLFNNIAIILFLLTLLVIGISFYLLIRPSLGYTDNEKYWINNVTVRIGASVLMIFLVQILFKVFKYLLRVAAFYNARADAIEFYSLEKEKNTDLGLDKLMDLFTPDKYDISELEKMSVLDNAADILKAKVGKG